MLPEGLREMTIRPAAFSTSRVATLAGCSVQQVRDLEAAGVIAQARRRPNGYRSFGASHVRDLLAYRDLSTAVGPAISRATMRQIRVVPAAEAASLVGDLYVSINAERARIDAARAALALIGADRDEVDERADDAMTITELGAALAVKASTLRFWESEGLIAPDRVATAAGTARRYPLAAIRRARITAALRSGGYPIPRVRAVLAVLEEFNGAEAVDDALDTRVHELTEKTLALLRASRTLGQIIEEAASHRHHDDSHGDGGEQDEDGEHRGG